MILFRPAVRTAYGLRTLQFIRPLSKPSPALASPTILISCSFFLYFFKSGILTLCQLYPAVCLLENFSRPLLPGKFSLKDLVLWPLSYSPMAGESPRPASEMRLPALGARVSESTLRNGVHPVSLLMAMSSGRNSSPGP